MASQLQVLYEGKIDFFGQDAVEKWTRVALSVCTTAAFVIGVVMQSLRITFGIFGVSVLVILLLSVPPWPYMNQFPVAWTTIATDDGKKKK